MSEPTEPTKLAHEAITTESFEFVPRDKPLQMAEMVFQALGAASMCWSEPPSGIFDRSRAREIGLKLLEEIDKACDRVEEHERS